MLEIVYDVDDVLNNLNDYVMGKLGLPFASRYNIKECKEYTEEEKGEILRMYGDPDTFRNLSFVDGAMDICKIEETGKARVWINSSCFNREIADIKYERLAAEIPGLNMNRVIFHIGEGQDKGILDFTNVMVEDCLLNLCKYGPRVKKILINKAHNQAKSYCTSDWKCGIDRVESLVMANKQIEDYVNTLKT